MPLSWIDGSLYPDTEIPENLPTLADRVDFLVRLCGAWDFGILPDWETVEEIRRFDWREAVEETNLLTSPVYHLLRSWHHLEDRPSLGQRLAYIDGDPELQHV